VPLSAEAKDVINHRDVAGDSRGIFWPLREKSQLRQFKARVNITIAPAFARVKAVTSL
jgi:hypothetical protein